MFLMTSKNELWKKEKKYGLANQFNSTNPSEWNSTGLSYNAPSAYACIELLALGLNHVRTLLYANSEYYLSNI